MRLRDLDECAGVAAAGRKAETLARLRAAGLPVLPGLVALPDVAVDAMADAAAIAAEVRARLPGAARLAVRSSSTVEDLPGASAAGVFASEIGVAPEDVAGAIVRVRASADDEPARAYLARAGGVAAAMAVLIQPLSTASRLGVARRLDGGRFLVEERAAGEPEWGDVSARIIDAPAVLARAAALVAPESDGGVDIEYAREGDDWTILQARPTPPVAAASSERAFVVEGGGDWLLDVEHNPRPLSPAQAGLVALVEAAGIGPRQRVLGGGWLYVARVPSPSSSSPPIAPSALRETFDARIAPACDDALAAAESAGTLEAALEAYIFVYRLYVEEVGPSLRAARAALDAALRDAVGEPLAAHGALLGGLGGLTRERDALLHALGTAGDDVTRTLLRIEYATRFGAYAPAWDVMVPTDDEVPARVDEMAAAWAARGRSPSELHAEAEARAHAAAAALAARVADPVARAALATRIAEARAALPVAEDDDRLFFRAQRVVRRALLSIGAGLAARGFLPHAGDVFWLSLDDARAPIAAPDLAARARANRLAWEAAARVLPPRALVGGRPLAEPAPTSARAVLRGHPTAGRARGRAVVIDDPALAPATLPEDAVLVVAALLPSLSYLLPQARALVTAHGGATSHGATLAREYGLPAVLGVGRAPALTDGTPLLVDGAAGRVYLL
jgi:pyruvate,water dikinase